MKTTCKLDAQRLGYFIVILLATAPFGVSQDIESARENRRTPVVRAVERVATSVVSINAQAAVRRRRTPWDEMFGFDDGSGGVSRYQDLGVGSGVVVDPKGYVITNDHVVGQATRVVVKLPDGTESVARIVGNDTDNDIALLKIEGEGPFAAATLGFSDDLMLGETTIAMGAPFGLQGSVTSGILSATKRPITFRGREVFTDFLQTSAVINPGNSGGPLLSINGDVIGVNVAIHSRGPGIGFAIPINRVREVLYRILDPRVTKKAWLGIDVEHARENRGAVVAALDSGAPAERAGVQIGDTIIGLNGQRIDDWIDFATTLEGLGVGTELTLDLQRSGKRLARTMAFAPAPASPSERAAFQMVGFEFDEIPESIRNGVGVTGVLVTAVRDGTSAKEKGVEAGDIVFSLGGYNVRDKTAALAIIQFISQRRAAFDIRVIRDGQRFQGTIAFQR